ncbi:MAG: hypothetical protein CMI63_02420 [Parvularcula sp.]|uniref:hypothetical protein n=1 Tax=Hyphococcus sp. TaxID=2038636 RepID=UPI000C6BBF88|nr:hypothetical protein [Parvularcula sp.]
MPAAARSISLPFYPAPSPSRYNSSHSHLTFPALRKFVQGIGSALLVFNGAGAITSPAAATTPAVADFSSIEGILATLMQGEYAGLAQIGAAAFIFLAAGQCVARFAGLIVAGLAIVLYYQGVTVEDVLTFGNNFAERLGAASNAFLTAEVSQKV